MANKFGFNPFIILSSNPGDDVIVIGGGTGEGGVTPPTSPMSYSAWLNSDWAEDIIENGTIDEYDYAAWWEAWGFTKGDWDDLNPSLDWDDYFG